MKALHVVTALLALRVLREAMMPRGLIVLWRNSVEGRA